MSDVAVKPKLVVGLGNPGSKYVGTRHNVGFDVLEDLIRRHGPADRRGKFDGELASITIAGTPVMLLWPLTYMNASGRAVSATARFYKVAVEKDVLVVCDDLSLPLGKLRMKARGSSGGQKGLGDILQSLGTQEVARLRVGIEPPPPQWDVADYVLSRFRKEEQDAVADVTKRAADAVELWCREGIDNCMNKINR
ncbi:MAG: aminoacyl-tRNA hydrolase [Pirellulales bacterium]